MFAPIFKLKRRVLRYNLSRLMIGCVIYRDENIKKSIQNFLEYNKNFDMLFWRNIK